MKSSSEPARGTRDFLPEQAKLAQDVAQTILKAYSLSGFTLIQTPCIENLNLLTDSGGGENEKLTFKILKRGDKLDLTQAPLLEDALADLGLRYDLTVPLARYYAQNQAQLAKPFYAIQMGPVWRAERPQKGRYRQFNQCDIDIIGDASPLAEIELILATARALEYLHLKAFTIHLNDRKFTEQLFLLAQVPLPLHSALCIILDKKDKLGEQKLWLEVADFFKSHDLAGKEKEVQKIFLAAQDIFNPNQNNSWAAPELLQSSQNLRQILMGVQTLCPTLKINFSPWLMRGLAYYTGTVFEITYKDFPFSIGGGGRYDNMMGRFLNSPVPACGFSLGFERLLLVLEAEERVPPLFDHGVVLLFEEPAEALVLKFANALRIQGRVVKVVRAGKKIARQLEEFKKAGFQYFAHIKAETDSLSLKELA